MQTKMNMKTKTKTKTKCISSASMLCLSFAGWNDIDLDAMIDVIFGDFLVSDTLSNWYIRPEREETRNFKDLGRWWSLLVASDRKMGVECFISLFSGQITSIIELMLMQLVNNRFNLWWLSGQGTSLLLRGVYEIIALYNVKSILTDFSADKIKGFYKKERPSEWNSVAVAGGHARGTCHV